MLLENYYQLEQHYYHKGIDDDLYTAKWGMKIEFLDLNEPHLIPFKGINFGLLGFKSDKGVYINQGRVGAVEGPMAIRQQLAKLPWHLGSEVRVFDVGNIDGPNQTLEQLQESLAKAVQRMCALNLYPIVLGGGHETAYGHFLGLQSHLPSYQGLGVINFDAHFDLRPYHLSGPNSGTGFRQMFDLVEGQGKVFQYLVLGIQEHQNNLFLFDFVAKSRGISFLTGLELYDSSYKDICYRLDEFLKKEDKVYLSIDMDVFSAGHAPGVSAIQSLGIDPNFALKLMQYIALSGRLVGFDVVEVSPTHDIDQHTANLAASFIFYLTQSLIQVL